jgi:hypothetical protein
MRRRGFKPMTAPQRSALSALRVLGPMVVTPRDARPLQGLKRRGLVAFYRDADGVKHARLRPNSRQRRRARKVRSIVDMFLGRVR